MADRVVRGKVKRDGESWAQVAERLLESASAAQATRAVDVAHVAATLSVAEQISALRRELAVAVPELASAQGSLAQSLGQALLFAAPARIAEGVSESFSQFVAGHPGLKVPPDRGAAAAQASDAADEADAALDPRLREVERERYGSPGSLERER